MAKILYVGEMFSSVLEIELRQNGDSVHVLHSYEDVQPFLKANSDTRMVIWEVVLRGKSIAKDDYVQEVHTSYPEIINVGVCSDPELSHKMLQDAGCGKVSSLRGLKDTVEALLS